LSDRRALIATFLREAGFPPEALRPLAGDASFRRYGRIVANGRRAVLMDAPPGHEDVRPYLRIARHLRSLGLSAPEILAEDAAAGLLLLEDLGDDTFTRLLADGEEEEALYALAVDVLVYLHRLPGERVLPAALPGYDEGRLVEEALLLTDWYLPAIAATPAACVRDAYIAAWCEAFKVLTAPPTLVLRDFHVDNLMRLPERDGLAACGLLDFQDAVAGHPAYDLMSLLGDARRDVPAALAARMRQRYCAATAVVDEAGFAAAFAVLAAQRHAKVIGIFTRLCRRDAKPAYLVHIPRVWRLLESALQHPALAQVAAWFARHLPAEIRRVPLPDTGAGA
jgi:aminoglycoside/choline kinase family phosphotransferase